MGSTTPESGAPVRQISFNPSGDVLMSATADAVRSWVWEDHIIPPSGGEHGGLTGIAGFGGAAPPPHYAAAPPVVCSTTIRCLKYVKTLPPSLYIYFIFSSVFIPLLRA